MSESIGQLNLEPLNIRRTNRRLPIFHKAINGHLALPIGNLQPVLHCTWHLNCKAFNTIHTSKDCYKCSFFPRTIKDWNSLPDKIATIKDPQILFELALTKLHQPWPFDSLGVLASTFRKTGKLQGEGLHMLVPFISVVRLSHPCCASKLHFHLWSFHVVFW